VIKNWKLAGFKSILNTDVDLSPLTIFAGANSSGKSTLLQSMLLLSQTMRSWSNNPLVLKGEYSELGRFKDILCDKSDNGDIRIGFSLEAALDPHAFLFLRKDKEASVTLVFSQEKTAVRPQLRSISLEFGHTLQEERSSGHGFSFTRSEDREEIKNSPDYAKVFLNEGRIPGEPVLRDEAVLGTNGIEIVDTIEGKIKTTGDRGKAAAVYYSHFLPAKIEYFDPVESVFSSYSLPLNIKEGTGDIEKYFSRYIKYLGPLREAPKKLYPKNEANIEDIGVKGENMASVLFENSSRPIPYLPPSFFTVPESMSSVPHGDPAALKTALLRDAVNEWVSYIGVAENISVDETDDDYIPRADGRPFTHVGVGVSQAAPIVVACLMAPRDSTIIIEQPELHLHPRMQSRLADFFIAAALSGRQCLIETHSEYLVDKLRLRICESMLRGETTVKDNSRIYFLDRDENKTTRFTEVAINKYAELDVWPEGFFDERHEIYDQILDAMDRNRESENDNDEEEGDD
jgi:predicted ATPase